MSTPSILNGRHIGRAHHAVRALLERELLPFALDFEAWTALNRLGGAGPAAANSLTTFLTDGLQITPEQARHPIDDLMSRHLIGTDEVGRLCTTPTGQQVWEQVTARVRLITAHLFEGVPAVHQRLVAELLDRVTERALAVLSPEDPDAANTTDSPDT